MSAEADGGEGAAEDENVGREVTFEEVAVRAYEIHISGVGGHEVENWLRAEKELQAKPDAEQQPEADRSTA
jgi:hypothetical protein